MYCIINVHHDTGDATTAWMRASTDNYNKYKDIYENLWTQIATTFKDYDEHLLFEGYNEMLDTYGSWCFASFAAPGQYNATSAADSYKAINKYAQSFVNAVRATGGNNSSRNLIVNSYCASNGSGNWNQHLLEPLNNLEYPTDEAKNHIIFQVHYYPSIKDLSWAKTECNAMLKSIKEILQPKAPVIFGVYASSPICRIVGEFQLGDILEGSPEHIWSLTSKRSGISKCFFDEYFMSHSIGFALEIKSFKQYETPINPYKSIKGFRAPQSFCYTENSICCQLNS